ncbi:KH domain-containing protein [Candidatus Parcubacteria bacterium]|nr:KH domain-containing protein [Candidatus Parcubacteria bacterium]
MTAKAAEHQDLAFVEYVVKAIVDNPDAVEVDRKVDEMGVLITLKVHRDDMGQLIGRQGSTARSLRTLLRIVGAKNNARVNLKIEEPEGGRMMREPGAPMGRGESHGEEGTSRGGEAPRNFDEAVDDLRL